MVDIQLLHLYLLWLQKKSKKDQKFISIFQSKYFELEFPKSVYQFIDLNLIEVVEDSREESLKKKCGKS